MNEFNSYKALNGNGNLSEELDWRIRVFESLSFPTLILKPNHMILSANRIFLEQHKLTLQEVIGKTCHEIFYESAEPCSPNICPVPKVIAERKGSSILEQVGHGKARRYEDRVFSPILDDNGDVAYIIESIRDVTRIKTLEKELYGIKEFVGRVVQSSASAIIAADRNGRIMLMNRAAKELFGYVGRNYTYIVNVTDLYPPGKAREIMKKLRNENIGGKGKLPSTQTTIVNSSGEEIPVEMTAAIIYDEESHEEVATMGIYNDLRERLMVEQQLKDAQSQLIQSEKMASLGQLAAGVAHEINNPLTGIMFYSGLVLEKMAKDDPHYEDLGYIIEDANRCKEIVKNLLAYSRQTNSVCRIVQVNYLLEQSLNLIRDQKVFANIELKKDMSPDMMLVNVDTNQICQVLINLVINAVDAMDGKGTLILKTFRDKEAGQAFLDITDTGCGIPDAYLNKIFDPFFTTKGQGKGTGLGLSTAIGIITENGGELKVAETGPQGTTFRIVLPLYHLSDEAVDAPDANGFNDIEKVRMSRFR